MSIEHPENRTDNLPPLDETAEVPLKHSEKVNSDDNWTGVQDTFNQHIAQVPAHQSHNVLMGKRTTEEELGERAKSNKGHLPWVAGAIASAIVVGGGIFGYNKVASDNKGNAESPAPTPDNVATAPAANPGETEPAETQPEAAAISAEVYKTPEQVVAAFVEQNNNWYADGATLENDARLYEVNLSRPDYATEVAQPGDDTYIAALFVDGWQNDSSLADAVEAEKAIHQSALDVYFMTADSDNPRDIEPYRRWTEFTNTQIRSVADNEFVASVRWQNHDNRDQNRAGDYLGSDVNDQHGGQIITFLNVDGNWKVSDIQPNA